MRFFFVLILLSGFQVLQMDPLSGGGWFLGTVGRSAFLGAAMLFEVEWNLPGVEMVVCMDVCLEVEARAAHALVNLSF